MSGGKMKKKLVLFVLVFTALFQLSFGQAREEESVLDLFSRLQQVIISVSDEIKPAVVHIEVVKKSGDIKYQSLASGLIVDEKGYILTNDHVVDKAQSVTITLPSKLEYPAEIIGTDKLTDLALVKIETPEELTVAKLGNSDSVEVGEWVIAVGNPYGFDRTVSFGIVSGKGRVLPNLPVEIQLINDFIQTDAAIDPGSSGGPLVNLKGEVVGINSIWVGRGQGFTIPVNTAIDVKDKLLASGDIKRGWIGITIQPLSRNYARYFGDAEMEGIVVSDVEPDSPARKAGLEPGDIIIEYEGEEVKAEKEEDLNKFTTSVSQTPPEHPAQLKIKRGGKTLDLVVDVGTKPKAKGEEYETDLGFTVEEITDAIYRGRRLEDKEGALVSFVEVGGPAGEAELREGDIIKKIERFSIKDIDALKDALQKLEDKKHLMFTVLRGKNKRFVLLIKEDEKQTEK
jgi:serine protease Do